MPGPSTTAHKATVGRKPSTAPQSMRGHPNRSKLNQMQPEDDGLGTTKQSPTSPPSNRTAGVLSPLSKTPEQEPTLQGHTMEECPPPTPMDVGREITHQQGEEEQGGTKGDISEIQTSDSTSCQPSDGAELELTESESADAQTTVPEMTPEQVKEIAGRIEAVQRKAEELRERVQRCKEINDRREKEKLFLEETLMGYMLQLDNIPTNGNTELRAIRKGAVHNIQTLIDALEANDS